MSGGDETRPSCARSIDHELVCASGAQAQGHPAPDPGVSTASRRTRRANATGRGVAATGCVGGPAGQHAESCPALVACAGRRDRADGVGGPVARATVGAPLPHVCRREVRLRTVLAREAPGKCQGPESGRAPGRADARPTRRQADDRPRVGECTRRRQRHPVRRDDGHGRHSLGGRACADRLDGRRGGDRPGRRVSRARSALSPHLRSRDGRRIRPLGRSLPALRGRRVRLAGRLATAGSIAARRRVAARGGRAGNSRAAEEAAAPARLLPSGDAYFLLDGAERELLVPREDQRRRLWTSRVWPGALLVAGEIRGTWRRAHHTVRIDAWARLPRGARDAIEAEANSLPLPGLDRQIEVVWET